MAEGPRSQGHGPVANSALSERAQELQRLLQDLLGDYRPRIGAALDIPQVTVDPKDIVDVCRVAKEHPSLSFKLLLCIAAVDYPDHFQMVYVLLSLEQEQKLMIKADLTREDPHLPTVTSVWLGADWYEREAHDLFGVVFDGHPELKPLILYEGFDGYPGRKEHPFHDYEEY